MTEKLQPILGADTCDPYFTVYTSSDNPEDLHVYFGMALLERVNKGTSGFQYKYLLARLYNGGFKRKRLVEAFNHPVSTLRRWGEAVRSGDIDRILNAFSGQGAECRLTDKIDKFIRSEFHRIYPDNKYSYSKYIRGRVKEIFDEEFSSECLRAIFKEEKDKYRTPDESEPECISESSTESNICDNEDNTAEDIDNIRNYSLLKPEAGTVESGSYYIHHIGLVTAMYMINSLNIEEKLVRQWLVSVLSGCANLEQTESLDFSSIEFLLGHPVISTAYNQHTALQKLSTPDNILSIFKINAQLINAYDNQYFYYDPHGIMYTGMKNILKGWCGAAGKITKVNYQDFFHTPDGDPVYFEINDNYTDMRERFINSVEFFSSEIINRHDCTYVIDRGIFGKEKMIRIDSMGYGLVTWEKGYLKDAWDDDKTKNEFRIHREKNHSNHIKTWDISYMEDDLWSKIPGFRRLIVRIQPPGEKKKTLEVSILTNGRIDNDTAVFAMLNRWIQENDFRYMIRHFGLNEITSYKAVDYIDIRELLAEKNTLSDNYKALEKAEGAVKFELKKLLLKKHIECNLSGTENDKVKQFTEQLQKLKEEKKAAVKYENKIDKLIRDNKCKLKSDKKTYLDAVKITARNLFYILIRILRPIYNDYRHDHQILREILRAHGKLTVYKSYNKIELDITRNYQPKQLKKINIFLEHVNQKINELQKNEKPVKITISQNPKIPIKLGSI